MIVIDDERLTSTERLVWYTLCTFARWKFQDKVPILADNVFPSHETIAKRAGLGISSVKYALKHLKELGYIEIISGGHEGRSNKYILKGSQEMTGSSHEMTGGSHQMATNNNTINRKINKETFDERRKKREAKLRQEREEDPEAWEKFMADIKERVSKHGTDVN
ncbi:MAG: helix-turn-helix domain-containing protein [Synergistaceae bacterium]|nr:helix-turn-helix domain-containing protein [Synergistaceae bacterium]